MNDDRWYNWNINNWGTKWDIDGKYSQIDGDDYSFQVTFETAWSPPEQIYYALREKYPTVDITWFYDEPGCPSCRLFGNIMECDVCGNFDNTAKNISERASIQDYQPDCIKEDTIRRRLHDIITKELCVRSGKSDRPIN